LAKTQQTPPPPPPKTPAKAVPPRAPAAGPNPAEAAKAKKPRKEKETVDRGLFLSQRKQGPALKIVAKNNTPGSTPLLQRFLQDPRILLTVFNNRPLWLDELAAVVLISLGVVSLLALFNNPSLDHAAISDFWADFLSQLFGRVGAILFALMLVGAGAVLILPRTGISIAMPWRRILAIEGAFLALLALLHLLARDSEPRALARSGRGGGHAGWALAEIAARLLGSGLATVLFLMILAFALVSVFGIRKDHLRAWGKQLSLRAEKLGDRLRIYATTPRLPSPNKIGQFVGRLGLRAPANDAHAVPLPPSTGSSVAIAPATEAALAAAPAAAMPLAAASEVAPQPLAPAPVPIREARPAPKPVSTVAPRPVTPVALTPPPAAADDDDNLPLISTPISTPVPLGPAVGKKAAPPPPPPPPERKRRYFTVDDFREARYSLPRLNLPPLNLLDDVALGKPNEAEINNNARLIEETLLDFELDVEVVDVRVGPTITQYAVQPFREVQTESGQTITQRVRINKIVSLAGDLGLALAAKRLRIQPYVPGFTYMGIEVPNREPSLVSMRAVMESEAFARAFQRPDPDDASRTREAPLVVPLGRDVSGEAVAIDLATMPHLLMAGTTGSGKSVCITALITALIMNNTPERMRLILLDPKMVELTRFNGIPHLLGPVETDHERIIGVMRWATREMDRRYKLLETEAARNIDIYNRKIGESRPAEQLPYIVLIMDEIGDLMLARPDEMERTVTRLAQMARAVGMHLVIATQRPSTDIITGLIKANFPSRISFSTVTGIDSRVILDASGAETLVGRGDMLYLAADAGVARRVQGCFVSDTEIDNVVNYWRAKQAPVAAGQESNAPWDKAMTRREALAETDSLLEEAITLVVNLGEASASIVQKGLNIPYPRAAQLMDLIGELGILGPLKADSRSREVLMKPGGDPYKKLMQKYKKNQT
jgi:DNA segregation ATPase FtsK/SpoIIIE, S-DNA-T family